ncbi:MAG: thioredoxin family protein, partial [Spirochaetota bacterium]
MLKNISRAQRELGTNIEIEESRDQKAITKHGVKSLPAVFSVKKELKSFGKVADKEV